MQKIIIDTNVFVSALIQKSYPYLIVNQVFNNRNIEVCISDELFEEYLMVLSRPKFSHFPDFEANARALLLDISTYSKKYSPQFRLDIISDKDDNKLLELAEVSNAEYLITGNTNDFTMKEYHCTKIVTPKKYWELVNM